MPDTRSNSYGILIGETAAAAILVMLASLAGLVLKLDPGDAAPVWLGDAILLAAAIRRPPPQWPGFLVAGFAAGYVDNMILGVAITPNIGFCLSNTVEVLTAAIFVRRLAHEAPLDLTRTGPLLRFLVLCAVVAPAISATIAISTDSLVAGHLHRGFWIIWFVAHSLGMVMVAPILLYSDWHRSGELFRHDRSFETTIVLIIVLMTDLLVFGQSQYPLLFCVGPALLLAAFRLGAVGARIAIAMTVAIGIALTGWHLGPATLISDTSLSQRLIFLQAFLAVSVVTVLQVSAALEARWSLERTLRDNEERFRLLVDGVSDHALFMLDVDGRVSSWNPGAERLKGYERSEILGKHVSAFFTDEDRHDEVPYRALDIARAFGKYEAEGQRVRKDGSLFWANVVINRIFDQNEQLIGFATVTQDTTERHQVQEALARENARFHAILAIATDGICVLDLQGNLLEASDTFYAQLGYGPDERPSLNIVDWDPKYSVARLAAGSIDIGPIPQLAERQFRRRDGSLFDVELAHQAVALDGQSYIYGSIRDITQRKLAEEGLRQSEQKFRAVAETAGEAIITSDAGGLIIYANPAAGNIFGYSTDLLIGLPVSGLVPQRALDGENAAEDGSLIDAIFRECDGVRADGGVIAVEFNIARWAGAGQSFQTIILRDVSQRQLQQRRLADSIMEKETLLREVYHRVKNNLQVIQSLLRITGRSLPPGLGRIAMDEAGSRVRAMALVHEKLYQSKNLARIDLAEYVRDLLSQVTSASGLDQHRIRMKADIGAIDVGLDTAVPLGLLINELVSNSVKHGFPHRRSGEIKISIQPHDGYAAKLTVRDTGIGLPEDFDLAQIKSMGLSVAGSLARQLGGQLRIESLKDACFGVEVASL